ncbi:chromate transporter [Cetobacterium sp. 8H]|uniref:chromate transporter n=1 Tax=Cetobacterium sp. 8H TaxID=2759681 RepID=UPI00163D3280|nr:chromate transporter [Cetobacterium sp. 8H]MBC2850609.1 chromate transporter [Cetobacterium sp. 8H]
MFELFFTFFKIGMFTFGGGYAMIPLIEKEIMSNKNWIDKDELLEIISISQMTPGPIAINAATFIGKKKLGFLGSISATLGVITPSLIVITIISAFFSQSFLNPVMQKLFIGLRAGIAALILSSVLKLSKNILKDFFSYSIFFISLIGLIFFNISPIFLILFFGIGSIIFFSFKEER